MLSRRAEKHENMFANSERAIRVLPFGGKKEEWNMWSKKFLARAKKLGYRHILMGEKSDDQKKMSVLNDNAYSDMLLAMNCEVGFDYVNEAVSEEFPEGDAALAWWSLMQKFQPSTTGSRVYYKNEFSNSKLHSDKDPDKWISGLEKLRKLVNILNNLPKTYKSLIDNFEKELDNGKLTVSDMRLRLSVKYERMKKREGASKSEGHTLV